MSRTREALEYVAFLVVIALFLVGMCLVPPEAYVR